ncbi:MAG: class I SAM-dependent methyltransferase [Ardenticatenaceae bacterium]|nr:class I SAM-dependent methyltransferase [Ardenticatenaceae bacterium]
MIWLKLLLIVAGAAGVWGVLYWLLVITEGVYLGRRLVVWLYDLTAFEYDKIKEYNPADEQILVVEPILGELRGVNAPFLLDVASGTGRVPQFLLADGRFNGRIVALEPSQKMMAYGLVNTANHASRVDWVQQTAVPLPFPNQLFDCVTCLEALEFFPSPSMALQEMIRVLKPGGPLIITRRTGWEARTFIGRSYSRAQLTTLLGDLGIEAVAIINWQSNYDLVLGIRGN